MPFEIKLRGEAGFWPHLLLQFFAGTGTSGLMAVLLLADDTQSSAALMQISKINIMLNLFVRMAVVLGKTNIKIKKLQSMLAVVKERQNRERAILIFNEFNAVVYAVNEP